MFHPDLQEPVTALLKKQTAQPHAQLEALLLPHLQAIANADDYASILTAFHGFFAPLERAIAPWISTGPIPDWHLRRKATLLRDDLAVLHGPMLSLPEAIDLPDISSEASALGALYVMEGSTLGGRAIAQMVRRALPGIPENALSFFTGYGPATGTMWTSFQLALTSYGDAEDRQTEMIEAANQTFKTFGTWIQHRLQAR
ncbi:MAG: biliverdin-producing heme oxygenase [Flaviaesturariibacter sp.]|nr:biliverdin-producing heme oxygenase [Flaviaesturariibacter sp.]